MSKPAPIYGGSLRLCSPGSALFSAPRCLTASRVTLLVHGVFTTRVTTPGLAAGWDADPQAGAPSAPHRRQVSTIADTAIGETSSPSPSAVTMLVIPGL
jgi:hypothetical protein